MVLKVKSSFLVNEFGPTSLCNVFYKIGSKSIVNRIKPFMHCIIHESQTEDRLIIDNAIITFEAFYSINVDAISEEIHFALKLNLSKAFDRVECSITHAMTFPSNSVMIIMKCMCLVSYSILLNGTLTEMFVPNRGIEQCDHLSLFLFIISAMGHLAMSRFTERTRALSSLKFHNSCPSITHLFIVDDSILFCNANAGNANLVARIL